MATKYVWTVTEFYLTYPVLMRSHLISSYMISALNVAPINPFLVREQSEQK
jgi:hypothetical protein